jgi:hypothetical protein
LFSQGISESKDDVYILVYFDGKEQFMGFVGVFISYDAPKG